MGQNAFESGPLMQSSRGISRGRPRVAAKFEAEIRQLYVRMMEEPAPQRLIGILRARLVDPKSWR
ncbi:MAG: hypothetical protein R3D05_16940 [Dongiaceae bacterium]